MNVLFMFSYDRGNGCLLFLDNSAHGSFPLSPEIFVHRNSSVAATAGTASPETERRQVRRSKKQRDSSEESEIGGSNSEVSDSDRDYKKRGGVSESRATSVRAERRRGRDRRSHTLRFCKGAGACPGGRLVPWHRHSQTWL